MSSMETPDDPGTPPLSEDDDRRSVKAWLVATAIVGALAMIAAAVAPETQPKPDPAYHQIVCSGGIAMRPNAQDRCP